VIAYPYILYFGGGVSFAQKVRNNDKKESKELSFLWIEGDVPSPHKTPIDILLYDTQDILSTRSKKNPDHPFVHSFKKGYII